MKKKAVYLILLFAFFLYGLTVGLYKIFPFRQLLGLKHYIEFASGSFEQHEQQLNAGSAEVLDTFLQRLLIKKIPLSGFSGHGGGISSTGDLLYVVSNKGKIIIFDVTAFSIFESEIPDIPMNFSGLIRSGHLYKNDFRVHWFRVNGIHSEYIDENLHRLYISHNVYDEKRDCVTHNVSRGDLVLNNRKAILNNGWETIFTAFPCIDLQPENLLSVTPYPGHISGGAIIDFDGQNLLVSVGDYDRHGMNGTEEYATDPSIPYGKFILVNKITGEWSVFASGNRNPTGIYRDQNSVIWAVENGPDGGDELNILMKGVNYGWPKVSLGIWYDPTIDLTGGEKAGTHYGFRAPVYSWIPSVAPSGLIRIEGNKYEQWSGDLLMSTMRDQSLRRLRLDGNSRVIYDERIYLGHRLRDLVVLPDKKIAAATDDGYLIIIDDGGSVFYEMNEDARTRLNMLDNFDDLSGGNAGNVPAEDRRTSTLVFQRYCISCHNLDSSNYIGPHLQGLLSRRVGGAEGYNYSQSLQNDTRKWSADLLRAFLENPGEVFPHTRMQKVNLSAAEIDSLIQFFQRRGRNM